MDPRFYPVRGQIAAEFAGILGRIHRLDWKSLGLDVLGTAPLADECGEREIERWEAIVAQESLEPQPVLRASFRWMRRHLPRPPRQIVLVHADYRTGNFLAHPSGEIRGILDWEMTHLGDPMEDVAWACIRPWRWLGNELVGGLMERSDFYRMYEESSGIQIDEEAVRFWEVLGNAKLAAIFLTGGRSYCEGRTKSTMMAFIARNVRRLELEILDLMGV
jgi:aminoglycoside phosphotransferase (APT) family kinase protein